MFCQEYVTCHLFPEPLLDSFQVLTELKTVNFSQNGYTVSFDANGDPVASYELVNWKKRESGSIDVVPVGYYDASQPKGQEFRIYRDITWVDGRTQVWGKQCCKVLDVLFFQNLSCQN